jgi:hypothetical protein
VAAQIDFPRKLIGCRTAVSHLQSRGALANAVTSPIEILEELDRLG